MIPEDEFDFILIGQKNLILDMINDRKFVEARACLTVLEPLWKAGGYEYKTKEVLERLRLSCERKAKNPKV